MQEELQLDDPQSLLMRIAKLETVIVGYQQRTTCSREDRKKIKARGKRRVMDHLGNTDTFAYKNGYRSTFAEMWAGYKAQFKIKSVDDTLEIDYTKAMHWLDDWNPVVEPVAVEPCFLCSEEPGTLKVEDGKLICETCAQIMGELAPEGV